MPAYRIVFDTAADTDLSRLPRDLAIAVMQWLDECALSPATFAQKPGYPYAHNPRFQAWLSVGGADYWAIALFKYEREDRSLSSGSWCAGCDQA